MKLTANNIASAFLGVQVFNIGFVNAACCGKSFS